MKENTMDEYTRRLMHLATIEAGNILTYGYRNPFDSMDAHLDDAIEYGHTFEIGIPGEDNRWLRVEGFRIGSDDAPVFRAAVALMMEHDMDPAYEDLNFLWQEAKAMAATTSNHA
jgi:hypothetical protein